MAFTLLFVKHLANISAIKIKSPWSTVSEWLSIVMDAWCWKGLFTHL